MHERKSKYPILPLILERWSPRAMSGEALSDKELMDLFEAARWAPSSFNNQPWRFIYAKRNTPSWKVLFDLLVEGNQVWAKNAAVLVVVVSFNRFEKNNKPAITHSFDTGAAWMALALEGFNKGLVTHGMQGFDYKKAKKVLKIPKDYTVEAMLAIGLPAPKEVLPIEVQKREAPSDRRPLKEIVMEGKFKKSVKKNRAST